MADIDNFQLNLDGVDNLISSNTNKILGGGFSGEGVVGQQEDYLSVKLSDDELLKLRDEYEIAWDGYYPKIKPQQEQNKKYLLGRQRQLSSSQGGKKPISSNLLFEATATFIPASLAKNPEPVVWSDNTPQGKQASNDLKTMLQFHAETLGLREKLSVMVWHWSVYFSSVIKYGWDSKIGEITMEVRKPQNFVLQPDGYIDEFGNLRGWLGERIEVSAKRLIELFPEHKEYVTSKVNGKLGTKCIYTEWWDDDMCFSTFYDIVLDKHKNEFFNYGKEAETDEIGLETSPADEAHNHFASPMKPYTFLSVFSLQEQPHDITNLIEQNISNQDQINDRDVQIDKNAKQANNSLAISALYGWNQENGHQAAQAIEDGDPILGPAEIDDRSIRRLPAPALPNGLMQAQENNKNTLRGIYGTQGITASEPDTDETAHGMVINTNRDASRIGGGMGDSLERVARAVFNYLTQMYYVFYDEPHFASVMGNGSAVSYVALQMQDQSRRFVVTVSANSMKPKDEVTEQNLATQLMEGEMLDPLSFFERINDPDPQESALRLMTYKLSPQQYISQYLSPNTQQQQMVTNQNTVEQTPGQQVQTPSAQNSPDLSQNPASSSLSQAPLPSNVMPAI